MSETQNHINFEETPPSWQASGAEPREELKQEGYQAGYRPPAAYFNWFWSTVSRCLHELQEKIHAYTQKNETEKATISTALTQHTQNNQNPHGVTKAQLGLGNVANTADSQKIVANSAKWNGKALQWVGHPPLQYFLMCNEGAASTVYPVPSSSFVKSTGGTISGTLDIVSGDGRSFSIGGSGHGIFNDASRDRIILKTGWGLDVTNWNVTAFAPCRASTFEQASSQRFKKNIANLPLTMWEKLLLLRPVSYQFNDNPYDEREKYGLIAEEVVSILPELVTYEKAGEGAEPQIQGLDYLMLFAPMLQLLQRHEQQIQNLQNQLDAQDKVQ